MPDQDPFPLRRFDITPGQIDRVVTVFYARIRVHPVLGPVFANHIDGPEWPAHETKIAGFWRNAILRERSYAGNPLRVHVGHSDILPEHFPQWLALFHEILEAELPARTAASWGALADRIGEGFRAGVVSMRRPTNSPPKLF